jgi:hypothetical protein
MSFAKLLSFVSLAAAVSAASIRRVACPDGVNQASNGKFYIRSYFDFSRVDNFGYSGLLRFLQSERRFDDQLVQRGLQ